MSDTSDIILTHLTIEGYRGVDILDIDLPPQGVIFSGTKGAGKTSALRAIEAALKGTGIGAECIHRDHGKAKLRVDFRHGEDELTAKRTISPRTTSAELEHADGTTLPKAKEQLEAIFGKRSLDPMKLWEAAPKDLRKMILEAMSCEVTAADLDKWCETEPGTVPWNVAGNGHAVLAAVREMKAKERARAKERAEELEVSLRGARSAAAAAKPVRPTEVTEQDARVQLDAARQELARLGERQRLAEQRETGAAETRAKVAALRAEAEALLAQPEAQAPPAEELQDAQGRASAARKTVDDLRKQLEEALTEQSGALARLETLQGRQLRSEGIVAQAQMVSARADELEAAVAPPAGDEGKPVAELVEVAKLALSAAQLELTSASETAAWEKAKEAASAVFRDHQAATKEVERLERIVRRLSSDAMAEISRRSDAIPGLEVTADDVLFEGKSIGLLSDGEKLEFAVEIAKRVQKGAKVLIIDGLEKLPPSLQPGFVRKCLEGGWILFGTRVADGALEVIDCYQLAQEAA